MTSVAVVDGGRPRMVRSTLRRANLPRWPEIDLLFEGINLGDLDFNPVTQTNDAPTATPDEMIARRIVEIEIVLQQRERDGPAHSKVRTVHEEAEISNISNQ